MTIALQMPDLIAARLAQSSGNVADETLRTVVCGLYREGRVSAVEAMKSLDITSRAAFERLIAEHRAEREWPDSEVERELATIGRLNR